MTDVESLRTWKRHIDALMVKLNQVPRLVCLYLWPFSRRECAVPAHAGEAATTVE